MIWKSIPLMTMIDVLIIQVVIYLAWMLFKQYEATKQLGLSVGVNFILFGLAVMALFHGTALAVMHIFPVSASQSDSMAVMTSLRLNWSWLKALVVIGMIAVGLTYLLRSLIPQAMGNLQELTLRLQKTEERYREFFENAADGIFRLTPDGWRYSLANPALASILGYESVDDLVDSVPIGRKIYVDPKRHKRRMELLLENGAVKGFESEVRRKNGDVIVISESLRAIRDDENKIQGFDGNVEEVTERKKWEDNLQESEARFNQIAAGIEDVFVISDVASDSVLYASPAYEQIWGRSPQKLYEDRGQWDADIHPDDVKRIQDSWTRMLEEGPYEEEYRVIRPDGSMRWVQGRAFPLRDENGQTYRVASIIQDITTRKEKEAALQESEARFNQIAAGIEDVFAITDVASGSVLYASPAYEQIWGRPVQQLYEDGGQWDAGVHPDDLERVVETWTRMKEKGVRYDEQYRVIRSDGSMRWVRSRAYPIHDENGGLNRIADITQDITERKQAEEALRASEANLRATLNSIGDAVISSDTEGDIVSMNPVAEQLTGWNLEDAQGKALTEVFNIVNAQTREAAINPVDKVIESGKIVGLANHTALIARDGTECQIADSAAPIYDVDEVITGVVLVFRDVTEEYRVREALQESESRFKQIAAGIEDVFVISDVASDSVLYASLAYEQIWGRSPQKLYEDRGSGMQAFTPTMSNVFRIPGRECWRKDLMRKNTG